MGFFKKIFSGNGNGSGNGLLGGIISSVSNIFTSGADRRAARKNAKLEAETSRWITEKNNQAQMELAKYQNDYNLQMWNKQNEYNTPAAQVARMKEAGLNPALMYSQGNTGNASPAPSAAVPDIDYSKVKPAYQVARFQWLKDIFQSAVSASEMLEDLRSKKLDNQAKEIENAHLEDWWLSRRNLAWQKFYWSGGIPGVTRSEEIARELFNKLKYQNDLTKGNYSLIVPRRELINATKDRTISLNELVRQSIYEFEKTTRPWIESLGMGYRPAFGAAGLAGNLLKMFMLKN